MSLGPIVFAQSFLGGTLEWITSGVQDTASFAHDWIAERVDAQVLIVITALVVVFAILVRVNSNRRL